MCVQLIVRMLIEHGSDPDATDKCGITPLMVACRGGHGEVVSALIAAGADVNAACTPGGGTALLVAVKEGRTEIVSQLIAAGADANQNHGLHDITLLMIASMDGHRDIVAALLAAGAATVF